jgi:hypothetical protein
MSLYHYVTLVIFMSFLVAVTPGSDLFHLVIAQEGDKDDDDEEEEDSDDNEEDFEEENSIQICCSWGSAVSDGILSYHIDDEDDDISENQQQAVRNAVEEWDTKIGPLELEELSSNEKSDIKIEFQEDREGGEGGEGGEGAIAGQSLNIFDGSGFIDNVQIIIYKQISDYEFSPAQIEQIAKHEMGHALGLGHANFEGNLMAERITAGTETISECEVKAVFVANNWKLTEELDDDDANNSNPDDPPDDNIICV